MPTGPFGFPRITSIGPFVSEETTGVIPRYKTKTFLWNEELSSFVTPTTSDPVDLSSEVTDLGTQESVGPGVRGSSFSLGGYFSEWVGVEEGGGISIVHEIDKENDIPFFYMSKFGKRFEEVDRKDVAFEIPFHSRETEVVATGTLEPSDSIGVIIHGKDKIIASGGGGEIEKVLTVYDEVSLDNREFSEWMTNLENKKEGVDKEANIMTMEPYNRAVAEMYGIEFDALEEKADEIWG